MKDDINKSVLVSFGKRVDDIYPKILEQHDSQYDEILQWRERWMTLLYKCQGGLCDGSMIQGGCVSESESLLFYTLN